jgi:hypothetical protein
VARADTDASVSPHVPITQAPAERERAGGRLRGSLRSAAWTLGCIGVLTAVVWSRHPDIFTVPLYAGGDEGVNSLLVIRAEHFSQLAGNYSRVGFHHPGAALIYMLTAGEVVFHNLLHIAPSYYNAQILGVTVYSVTLLVLTGGALGRLARSRWVGTVAIAAGFIFMADSPWLSSVWFPNLYAPAFLAFTVAAGLVAAGRSRELPLGALAAGILVHGHVAFILFVAVTSLVAAGTWWLIHRGHVREEAHRARVPLWVALGVVVVFLAPLVLLTVRNFPGPWPAYLHFGAAGDRDPRTVGDAIGFVLTYWTETPWPVGVYVVAAVIIVFVTAVTRDSRQRLAYTGLLASVVLQTALAVVYAYKGVDQLDQRYIEEFYKAVPLVVVLGALTALGSLLMSAGPASVRVAARVAAGLAAAALVVVAAQAPALATLPPDGHTYQEAAVALRDDPSRADQRIGIRQAVPAVWPGVAGVAVQLDRLGVPWCVGPEEVILLYTPQNVCHEGEPLWNVTASNEPPKAGTTIWGGETVYVPMWLSR